MYIIFNTATGEILRQVNCPEAYIENQLEVSESYIGTLSNEYLDESKYYIVDLEIVSRPIRESSYQIFDWVTKMWEYPAGYLEEAKMTNISIINNTAGEEITKKYPTYRQMNYNREPTAQATIDMNLWIDGIRAESNVATSSIDLATDLATIEGIVEGFKAYLANL